MILKSKNNFLKAILLFFLALITYNTLQSKCVYLKPLKIKAMDLGNTLAWTTVEEVDVQTFVIEKSNNGIDFRRVGDVKGAGYSHTKKTYRFLDLGLPEHKTYYRLLHYASDGSYTISETFYFEQSSNSEWLVSSISSTLTNEQINVTLKVKNPVEINFEVRDQYGQVVKTGKKSLTAGDNRLLVNCKAFKNGKYNVVLIGNKGTAKIGIKKVTEADMPSLEYVAYR
ncbi:MAG TPA: hypothetical protein ENJ53_09760 [Phaeodactylibacter sp.]|nr:hypothetical protein [Phaeodactylibacter sp.]